MKNILIVVTVISLLLLTGCADAGKDQKVKAGDLVTLDGSASQSRYGFTILEYKWKQSRGKHVEIENKNERIATFSVASIGNKKQINLEFELTTVERLYWGGVVAFKDKVKITVEKSSNSDVKPPVITLNGNENIGLFVNDEYKEEGATAIDDTDGDVAVSIQGTVDTSTVGIYTVTYSATDAAGNVAHTKRTITVEEPMLTSLKLESNTSMVNVGEQVWFGLMGTYSDTSTKEEDANITWIMSPADSLEVNGTGFIAKRDGNVTVQAKVKDVLSNVLTLNVMWIVAGHILPPEPDPTVNNSTLLGIDANTNGVRDDVERWIYNEYKDKHPIHVDIAMQAGRAYKLVLETPEKAKEIHEEVDKAVYCQGYYKYSAKYYNDPILIQKNAVDEYYRSKIYFNTKMRMDAYDQYDILLSGDSYTLPTDEEKKAMCDFNTAKYEE